MGTGSEHTSQIDSRAIRDNIFETNNGSDRSATIFMSAMLVRRTDGVYLQRPDGEHENQNEPLFQAQCQTIQLVNWEEHDDDVLENAHCSTRIHECLLIRALSNYRLVPRDCDGYALEDHDADKNNGAASHPHKCYVYDTAELSVGENPEV